MSAAKKRKAVKKIRYAVVGLGYISQIAVLPAFKNATKNSRLMALVSGDPLKRKNLGEKYKVPRTYAYEQYDQCLHSGEIDAVYIALPNSMHCEYALRAARAGIHVLCEKPMAVNEEECEEMIDAAEANHVQLMIAYRLHFEQASLKAVQIANSGKLGETRMFNSLFSMHVADDNIRVKRELGGGTLPDIGIYCINAARAIFREEPYEVFAQTSGSKGQQLDGVEEMTSCILRFPGERLATFTCSFGAADLSSYRIVGTKGILEVNPAYDFGNSLKMRIVIGKKEKKLNFPKRDQFAPELVYFSDCILNNKTPEPSGNEGLADIRIIQALYQSAHTGQPVVLGEFPGLSYPALNQEIRRAPVKKPTLIHATTPSGELAKN